jgi:hypothetical protein
LISSHRTPSGRPELLPVGLQDEFEHRDYHQEEENEQKLSLQDYQKDTIKLDVCKPKRMRDKHVQAVNDECHPILAFILFLGMLTVIFTWSQWAYSAIMYFA